MIGHRSILTTDYAQLPAWRSALFGKDKFGKLVIYIRKHAKARIKTSRRSLLTYSRKQYFFPAVYRDARRAVKQNEDIFIAAVATFVLVAYVVAILLAQFLTSILTITYAFAESNGINAAFLILIMGIMVSVVSILMAAFSLNFIAYALMDGINRKKYRSIRSTARKSLQSASRTTLAWSLYGLMILSRVLAMVTVAVIADQWTDGINKIPIALLVGVGLAGLIWLLSGMLTYSLMPAVALYEPKLLLVETFSRSRKLTSKGSKFFLLSGGAGLALYCAGLYAIMLYASPWIGAVSGLMFAVGLLIGVVAVNSGLVLVYRKRKLSRS